MPIDRITAAGAEAQEAQRVTLALAKVLRVQRQQGDAAVALIQQAAAPAPSASIAGRILDVRA